MKKTQRPIRTVAPDHCAPELAYARVAAITDDWMILDGAHQYRARVAAACFLSPEVGDRVLVSLGEHASNCFVLSVLERPRHEGAEIGLPGGARLLCSEGKIRFEAEAIEFSAEDQLKIEAKSTHLGSSQLDLNLEACRGADPTIGG